MYRGEYIEYTGSPLVLKEYTIGTVLPSTLNEVLHGTSLGGINGASSDSILAPDEVVLLASNDSQNWTVLNHKTNLTPEWQQALASYPHQVSVSFTNSTSYTTYRWIFPKLCYQNFSFVSVNNTDGGILCTELYAKTDNNLALTIFPEGVTTPSPASEILALPGVTPNPPTGLVFVQVRNYPFLSGPRDYNGNLITYLDPSSAPTPSPTPEPTPAPTPSPTPEPTPEPTPGQTLPPGPTPTPLPTITPEPSPTPTPGSTPTPLPSITPEPSITPYPYVTPTPLPTITPTPTPRPSNVLLFIIVGVGVLVLAVIITLVVLFLRKKPKKD